MMVNVVRLLASLIDVNLGFHSLLRHLRILLVAFSLETGFPSAFKRLVRWTNIFCISEIDSPCFMQKSSKSWLSVLIRDCLTSVVPSWATSKASHISLVVVQ